MTAGTPRRGTRLRLDWLYGLAAVLLVPWIVYLYNEQETTAVNHRARLLSVGILLAMVAGMVVTASLWRRRSRYTVMVAAFTGTLTAISAWFRLLTRAGGIRWPGSEVTTSVLAVAVVTLCALAAREMLPPVGSAPYRRWQPVALFVLALGLLPLLFVVFVAAREVQLAYHLRLAWTGLDVFELVGLALTAVSLHHGSPRVVMAATMTGTLLVCDAWFNIVTTTGVVELEGWAMAVVELPLAALSYWIGVRETRTWAGSPSSR